MQKSLLLTMFILCTAMVLYGQKSISGVVNDASGEPLIGANIIELGTSNGTITDLDGTFQLTVAENASIEVTFTGYTSQSVNVSGRDYFDIVLQEGAALEEVVVTALGISREKKALSYATQTVNTEELSKARELNVINSLAGKVAGASISRGGGGVGSEARVILRGNRSLAGSSQPLYVVDGVPIIGDASDINPDDVATISVLKGANAAALYGNRAQNGVIIINTKSGKEGFNISVNSSYTTETPLILRNYQTQYAQGNSGQYNSASEQTWGPAISGQSVDHWSPDPNFGTQSYTLQGGDPVRDFYQTGGNLATSFAISGGTDKSQTYLSYTFTDAKGTVPNNELSRHNVNLRITNQLSDKLSIDAKVNYIREDIDNRLATGESFENPNRHAYRIPTNIRTEDLETFEYTDATGRNRQHYFNPGSNGGANPYWTINRNLRHNGLNRVVGFMTLGYEITDDLKIQARTSLDNINGEEQYRLYNDTYINADNGSFSVNKSNITEFNADVLLTYNKYLSDDLSLSVSGGANTRKERGTIVRGATQGGTGLIVPNLFGLTNTLDGQVSFDPGFGARPRDVNSVYAFANIGWKNAIYIDASARNDWSSTLPAENWSFFYPSVGASFVISELADMPSFISFLKLRGSWAQVGNDTDPYQLSRLATVGAGGANGFLTLSPTIANANLLPEKTTSIEVGADMKFANNRIGLDFTYYKSNTRNQLFSIQLPIGSGASQIFTNGGDVQNSGVEAVFTASPVVTPEFTWNIGFNFAHNRSKVIEINDERPSIAVGSDFLREFRIEQGEEWGTIYSRGFERDAQGRVLIGDNGLPLITSGRTVQVANFNPDWMGGLSNSITYKDISLSFLIDMRIGGSVTSITDAIIFGDGLVEETLQGREGGLIFGENFFADEVAVREDGGTNNVSFDAETFWRLVGGRNAPVGEVFTQSATNIRLREFVLGTRLPLSNSVFKGASISLVGRNLFFLRNDAKTLDPEVLTNTGKAAEGFNSFAPPTTRSFGLNLQFDF